MAYRRRDIKKSDFPEVTSSEPTDKFDLVRNGQNLKITQENLSNSLGVSGPLEALGEVTAVPVLQVIAAVNYIRNLLAGAGINISVSPQNGIQIAHNFTVNKHAVAIMEDEGASSPTFRSIEGTGGITVSGSAGVIQIAAGAPASTKTVNVYNEGDFPTPSGGIITLADDTEYLILNDISTINRFIFGNNCILSGADGTLINLEYTGAGTMLTAADKSIKIKDVYLKCNSGTLFDVSSTTGLHIFRLYTCGIECYNVGNFHNLNIFLVFNTLFYNILNQGFTFSGNTNVALFDVFGMNMFSGSGNAIDLGSATFSVITLTKCSFTINTTGYVLTGLPNSGNINVAGNGSILNVYQFGSAAILNNISQYDDRWEMRLNSQIINSIDLLLATNSGTTVSIASAGVPVKIGAAWVIQDEHRFTGTTGGTFTYNGKGSHVSIVASISADIVTGTDDISFFIYLNGVQIPASRVIREFTAGNIGNLTVLWESQVLTNDYIELWVQNDDTSVDVIISSIQLRIRS